MEHHEKECIFIDVRCDPASVQRTVRQWQMRPKWAGRHNGHTYNRSRHDHFSAHALLGLGQRLFTLHRRLSQQCHTQIHTFCRCNQVNETSLYVARQCGFSDESQPRSIARSHSHRSCDRHHGAIGSFIKLCARDRSSRHGEFRRSSFLHHHRHRPLRRLQLVVSVASSPIDWRR
jgi:hypothetical protein